MSQVAVKTQELGMQMMGLKELPFLDIWNQVQVYSGQQVAHYTACLLYTSPSPRDQRGSRMPSSA